MEIAYIALGLALGSAAVFLILRARSGGAAVDVSGLEALRAERDDLSGQAQTLRVEAARLEASRDAALNERDRLSEELSTVRNNLAEAERSLASARQHFKDQQLRLEEQDARSKEQRQEFEELNKRFNTEFENLANRILEEKSKSFTEKNRENIDAILTPLRERIKDFEQKVERNYGEEKKEKAALGEQIKHLMELNQRISEEANNLASALKGDTKKQGGWGELILERILESSGLVKDQEYVTQYSTTDADGTVMRPDVVIKLPDDKHLIIDSKVSLVAYERFANADDPEEQARQLKAHVDSVKMHVKQLSDKAYHSGKGLQSPDFVMMFMPIESSFSHAVKADNELFNFAWEKKVVIVSPSTLLATLRTISAIWKQERQTRNAIQIAEKSGMLYDKFVGFTEDLLKVGRYIDQAQNAHTEARKKLSEGRGNLVGRAEELRKLGAKAGKAISKELNPGDEDEDA